VLELNAGFGDPENGRVYLTGWKTICWNCSTPARGGTVGATRIEVENRGQCVRHLARRRLSGSYA
jgi:hypothetical protein